MRRHLIDHALGRPVAKFVSLDGIALNALAQTKSEWCTLWRHVRQWLFEDMDSGDAKQSAGR